MIPTVSTFLFYLFASVLVASALMVVLARNPVHSVLFLILAFFNAAGLFLLLGAEFVAFILIIVYVGAVAVLFLFVVMMLDIDFAELRKGAWKVWPVGLLVGAALVAQLVLTVWAWQSLPGAQGGILSPASHPAVSLNGLSNTHALGNVLYTDFVYPFQVAGLILLVAMIGAITLTLRVRHDVRRQNINNQITRRPEDAMVIKQVEKGAGAS
ncbi:MAG: NADH-quinone oxidoreductase subunit J [Proteobacteria bacterium]|nr:NADH-quinone oxidoreductase subunit J [Pseudomonadota bacterium]